MELLNLLTISLCVVASSIPDNPPYTPSGTLSSQSHVKTSSRVQHPQGARRVSPFPQSQKQIEELTSFFFIETPFFTVVVATRPRSTTDYYFGPSRHGHGKQVKSPHFPGRGRPPSTHVITPPPPAIHNLPLHVYHSESILRPIIVTTGGSYGDGVFGVRRLTSPADPKALPEQLPHRENAEYFAGLAGRFTEIDCVNPGGSGESGMGVGRPLECDFLFTDRRGNWVVDALGVVRRRRWGGGGGGKREGERKFLMGVIGGGEEVENRELEKVLDAGFERRVEDWLEDGLEVNEAVRVAGEAVKIANGMMEADHEDGAAAGNDQEVNFDKMEGLHGFLFFKTNGTVIELDKDQILNGYSGRTVGTVDQ